jgi:hypothetical protein
MRDPLPNGKPTVVERLDAVVQSVLAFLLSGGQDGVEGEPGEIQKR